MQRFKGVYTCLGVTSSALIWTLLNRILLGTVAAFTLIITFIGPEHHGSHFEKHVLAFEKGGGRDETFINDEATSDEKHAPTRRESVGSTGSVDEKRAVAGTEERKEIV